MAKAKSTKPTIQCQLKLRLTCAQEATFRRWLWHLTGVYNWAVKTVERERSAGKMPTARTLKARLNGHSRKMQMPADVLCGAANTAYDACARHAKGLSGRPRLKSRRRPLNSILLPHGVTSWKGSRPLIKGMGYVRVHKQDVPAGHVGYARIVKRASGWYLCLFVQAHPKPIERVASGHVGIDPGFSSLLTMSSGERVEHPRELARTAGRLAQAQRGGRRKLSARLLERTRNQRKNRNHHISRRLVSENTLIAFSADNHRAIARKFGKSVDSAAHGQLRSMLRYKSLLGGSEYIEVASRNSTRICSSCGRKTGPTGLAGLSIREWDCGGCGASHDRDVNASINALISGLGMSLRTGREVEQGIAEHMQHREVHEG